MFTGIVEGTGEVIGAAERRSDGSQTATGDAEGGRRLRVRAPLEDLRHGQSISVSGVCLTVEEFGTDEEGPWFEVFLAAETVDRTYLGSLAPGDAVNVERALAADGRFDGHLVQGHVDTTTTLTGREQVGDDWRFEFALPDEAARYVVEKGSITLDGVSLTVAERGESSFDVAVVPTTYDLTTLSAKSVGDPIHVEVDVVAKYVERLVDGY